MEDELTQAEVSEILASRAAAYSFLSRAYRQEASAAFLQGLVEELANTTEEDAESEGHRLLRHYVRGIAQADLDNVETELGAEYAALFLNASPKPVHPFESVYTSSDRLLMQQARDEVLAEYRQEGLARIGDFKEPEDHIAIELEFMAHLCQKTAEALGAGDTGAAAGYLQKQQRFLEKHLLVWVPAFCRDLAARATSDFYRGIGRLTEE
ncbi:MAG TPA: molecular chaperone TorD family protein, partial [Anaerolineae bacterium]|nr:molecular chaperone TorD family protein [Anaerolineae bacterium]